MEQIKEQEAVETKEKKSISKNVPSALGFGLVGGALVLAIAIGLIVLLPLL